VPQSCSERSARSNASTPTPNSPATPASHHSKQAAANTNATASTAAATVNSTAPSTASPSRTRASIRPRAYLERKQTEGKSRREALRCLKRQLARTVYTTLKNEPLLT